MNKYSLTLGWLYPELMSTYGDRGNVTVLERRCEWRNIGFDILRIDEKTKIEEIEGVDMIFGGGSQDREQELVMRDLKGKKGNVIKELIEKDVPALFVCGSPQLMGNYYEPAEGKRIEGLGIFDMYTKHAGLNEERLIGNIVGEVFWENLNNTVIARPWSGEAIPLNPKIAAFSRSSGVARNDKNRIVGFENHGGRTYLGKNVKPFAKVIKGFGNNGRDGTEGVVYKNAIGCYFHGPLLPKNPEVADFLIARALLVKYKEDVTLRHLDDSLEMKAKEAIMKRLL